MDVDAGNAAGNAAAKVIEIFQRTDADKNGVISKSELTQVLDQLAPGKWDDAKVSKLITTMDVNGDGVIQYEEFVSFVFDKNSHWNKAKKQLIHFEDPDSSVKIMQPAVVRTQVSIAPAKDGQQGQGGRASKEGPGGAEAPPKSPGKDAAPPGGRSERKTKGDTAKTANAGCILVFFDVDGVLNCTGDFNSDDDDELTAAFTPDLTEQPTIGGLRRTISDSKGRWAARLSEKCLGMMNRLVTSFEEKQESSEKKNRLRLVLTSSWRFSEDQTAFVKRALMKAGISDTFFLGVTAGLCERSRGEEILHYISELAALGTEVAGWVAIDSDADSLSSLPEEHRVLTSEMDGLDAASASKARSLLAMQVAEWCSFRNLPPPGYPDDFDFGTVKKNQRPRKSMNVKKKQSIKLKQAEEEDAPLPLAHRRPRRASTHPVEAAAAAVEAAKRNSAPPPATPSGGHRRRSASPGQSLGQSRQSQQACPPPPSASGGRPRRRSASPGQGQQSQQAPRTAEEGRRRSGSPGKEGQASASNRARPRRKSDSPERTKDDSAHTPENDRDGYAVGRKGSRKKADGDNEGSNPDPPPRIRKTRRASTVPLNMGSVPIMPEFLGREQHESIGDTSPANPQDGAPRPSTSSRKKPSASSGHGDTNSLSPLPSPMSSARGSIKPGSQGLNFASTAPAGSLAKALRKANGKKDS